MPRVHEVAKELGISSKEVLERLDRMGEPAKSHSSTIDDNVAERLRDGSGTSLASAPSAGGSLDAAGNGEAPVAGTSPEPVAATAASGDGAADPETGDAEATAPASGSSVATETRDEQGDAKPAASDTAPKRRGLFRRKPKPIRSRGRRILAQIAELPLLVFVAFLIAVVIKTFIMQAFYIPSGSMKPTLQVGDRVLVEKVTSWLGGPGRGDVVVFARNVFPGKKGPDLPWYRDAQNYVRELLGLPTGREEDYIKRIVAESGDTIRYDGSPRELFVNGEKVEEDYLPRPDRGSTFIRSGDCPPKMDSTDGGCLVPAGKVFVMGDNRANSADSRSIGPVDEEKIVGRAFVVIWPLSNFGGL